MSDIQSNLSFGGTETGGTVRTGAFYSAGGAGTVKLQALVGNDEDNDNWVDMPDSSRTGSTVYTFYACPGMLYRWVLTGDMVGWHSH